MISSIWLSVRFWRYLCQLLLAGFMLTACAQQHVLYRADGTEVLANDYPLMDLHRNLPASLNYLDRAYGLASTPPNCPSYYAANWGGYRPESRALDSCSIGLIDILRDYDDDTKKKCECVIVLKDRNIKREDILKRKNKLATVKLFTKGKDGSLKTVRGFLEYERDALVGQKSRILNRNFEEICHGEMTFSIGEGGFDLSCYEGNVRAKGVLSISSFFKKIHAVGSGALDTGEVFAFVTRLNDDQIDFQYPNFPE